MNDGTDERTLYTALVQEIRRLRGLAPLPFVMLPEDHLRPYIRQMQATLRANEDACADRRPITRGDL